MTKELNHKEIVADAVAAAVEIMDERHAEAEAAEKARMEAKAIMREEIITELADDKPDYKSVGYQKKSAPGEGEASRKDAWLHWARTGDDAFLKKLGLSEDDSDLKSAKAMQGGTATEGGYLVPDDWYLDVVERRDKVSFIRGSGASIYNTSRDNLSFAVEDAAAAKFTITSEEGTYNDTDRALAQKQANIYKFTRVTLVSEELLEDDAMDLGGLLASQFAREEALTENYYVAVGTGSSQPEGVFLGGTSDAYTDTGLAISADGVMGVYGALSSVYRPNAAWLSHSGTQLEIRKLRDTNNWVFGDMYMTIDTEGTERLLNKPYFTQDDIGRASIAGDSLLIGDFAFYAFVERKGLVVTRNPFLYEATGQVAFFGRKRFGGVVLQKEAFQILKTAS